MAKKLIGVVGLPPLPNRFNNTLSLDEIIEKTVQEATILAEGGVDSAIVQNLHDLPPTPGSSVEVAAYMTAVLCAMHRGVPCLSTGVNVLVDDYKAALAAAAAAGSGYVRLKSYVGAAIATHGYSQGCCAQAIDYRHRIGADHVQIYADVQERMSRSLAKEDCGFLAGQAVGFGKADAVIITADTVEQAVECAKKARTAVGNKPLVLGGGANLDNMALWAPHFDAVIVGLGLRESGYQSAYSATKINAFCKKLRSFA